MSMLRHGLLALAAAAPLLGAPHLAGAQGTDAQGTGAPPSAASTGEQGPAARTTTDPQVRQALPPASQTQGQQSQENGAGPPRGTPELQGRVPESQAAGQNAQQQVPNSTFSPPPTGTPAPAQPMVAPTPVQPIPAPQPFGDRMNPSAEELELQKMLQGGRISGRVSIPDAKAANLIQPEGRDWRDFHNRTLLWVGGVAVLGMLGILTMFFLVRGRIRLEQGWSGRTMQRFNFLERTAHWMTASTFIVLGLSGLNLTFGRYLILPLIGPEAFTTLSMWGKVAHNFLAFPFTLGVVLLLLLWARDNIPNKLDWVWVTHFGGLIGNRHPQAGRFNAGQKSVFWLTVLGGAAVAASGYILVFPFTVTDVAGQQLSHMVHGVLSLLMFSAMLAHIYIGSVGMEGAFSAMGSGQVDYNWARSHHGMWVDDELKKAHEAARPTAAAARPAGAD